MIQDRPGTALFSDFACQLLSDGFCVRFRAKGRSMAPRINDGDILHVAPVGSRKLKVGEIILFRCGTELKAHRIIRLRGEIPVTRGDAGLDNDGEIRREDILGVVTAKECEATGSRVHLSGIRDRLLYGTREIRRRMLAKKRITAPAEVRPCP